MEGLPRVSGHVGSNLFVFLAASPSSQAFQVDVVNQHSRSVKVRIIDRIPVSRSSDIEVFVESLDGGELDPVTGWITWEMTLSPGAQKTLSFSYKVEYPKKFSIQGL